MPSTASCCADAAIIQDLRNCDHSVRAGRLNTADQRHDVRGKALCFAMLRVPAYSCLLQQGCCGFPSAAPWAFFEASALRVRSEMSRRSFSASAA